MKLSKADRAQAEADIAAGKIVTLQGRSAATIADLDFIEAATDGPVPETPAPLVPFQAAPGVDMSAINARLDALEARTAPDTSATDERMDAIEARLDALEAETGPQGTNEDEGEQPVPPVA